MPETSESTYITKEHGIEPIYLYNDLTYGAAIYINRQREMPGGTAGRS
jgi:hypothetical protein